MLRAFSNWYNCVLLSRLINLQHLAVNCLQYIIDIHVFFNSASIEPVDWTVACLQCLWNKWGFIGIAV